MRITRRTFSLTLMLSLAAGALNAAPNILFIAIDDLRAELGAYGADHIHSPHMDGLAERSLLFERAYCMVPTCGASRSSMLSGVRPTETRFRDFRSRVDEDAPWAITLPAHLKAHGYETISLGKVFHAMADNADAWSLPPWRSDAETYARSESQALTRQHKRGPLMEGEDVPDDFFADGQVALKAVSHLRRLAEDSERRHPFFLAVGFERPHLPFVAPRKYWDLYPPEIIALPTNDHAPAGAPAESIRGRTEISHYSDGPQDPILSKELSLALIRGYYATTSYVDALVGQVVDALDELGLADSTTIVLWSDHGFSLGERGYWTKHSTFEIVMRIPLMIRVPDKAEGERTFALTESIDLYPTLCELAGIPIPDTVEGTSLMPLLDDPHQPWKQFAIGRNGPGYTVRTNTFRFTEYSRNGKRLSRMLYDLERDPEETVNLSEAPYLQDVSEDLTKTLHRVLRETEALTPQE